MNLHTVRVTRTGWVAQHLPHSLAVFWLRVMMGVFGFAAWEQRDA